MSDFSVSERTLLYNQDISIGERGNLKRDKQEKMKKLQNEKSSQQKSDDTTNFIEPQDENCYVLGKILNQKPSSSRKREAGNILMECVKRRDNQRNINFFSNVPLSWEHFNCLSDSETGKSSACKKICSYETDALELPMLNDTLQYKSSGNINSNNDQEDDAVDLMDIDSTEELPLANINDSKLLSSRSCNSSASDLSSQSSVAIYEDLNCLHLTDESGLILDIKSPSNLTSAKTPIYKSLFKAVSPSIYFAASGENIEPLPDNIRELMKWKLSTITPILIRETVARSGFSLVNGEATEDWIGTWGKHMKCATFKRVKGFQKVNHFPGSFNLGRKDKLWDNYKHMQSHHGVQHFHFFPDTYVLPNDFKFLKQAWGNENSQNLWILKPPASARGTGIKVIHKWSQVPKNKSIIVQRYVCDPYLINGTKFDLRIYVLVSSIEPLRIYMFDDGLVRFASEEYSLSSETFNNRYMHLTNYSINRKSSSYTHNNDRNSCQGHKWTLKSFWTYLANSGVNVDNIKESIVDMIIKTIICSEGPICRLMKTYAKSTYNCFELFGFDIMLDKELSPWLLEVNISPSLHTRSMLDSSVKGQLVKDMLNIASFQVPEADQEIVLNLNEQDYGIFSPIAHRHRALRNRFLSTEEKNKHSIYTFDYSEESLDILEDLTPDDVRCLIESEDEFNRKGSFIRVFPSETSSKYFNFFEHIRYYNLLLDAWEKSYAKDRESGISLLQNMCEKNLHLQTATKENTLMTPNTPSLDTATTEAKSL